MRLFWSQHFVSDLQPSGLVAILTQPYWLGWYITAPLALERGWA